MSPEQLDQLKELSELFSNGQVKVRQVKQLSEILDKINNKQAPVVDYNSDISIENN